MSHRIIEKRRRDRMNNCLADLSRLIPAEYLKKGRGRVEKTEIIEMAIRHMKHLQGLRQGELERLIDPSVILPKQNYLRNENVLIAQHRALYLRELPIRAANVSLRL